MPTEGVPTGVHNPSAGVEGKRLKTQVSFERMASIEVKNAERNPTIIDLQGLNMQGIKEGSKEEEKYFLEWIQKVLKVDHKLVQDEKSTKESNDFYNNINQALADAKDFLFQTLRYPKKQSIEAKKIERLDSKEDIFSLLRRTRLAGEKGGLEQTIVYCRLVKVTMAMYRLLVAGVSDLEEVKKNIEETIMTPSAFLSRGENPIPMIEEKDNEYEGKTFFLASNSDIKGTMDARIKTIEKAMLRFITRPEANEHAAMEDATAFRLTVDSPVEAMIVLKEIYTFLGKNEKIKILNLRAENKNVLDRDLVKALEKMGIKITTTSKKGFEGLIIKGGLGGNEPNKQFEIQIVLLGNKNEEGGMHHDIYDIKKKVIACTRLSGGCSIAQYQEFVDEALKCNPMLDEEEIEKELITRKDAPIVKIKRKGGQGFVAAREVYQRWDGFMWVDKDLAEEILF